MNLYRDLKSLVFIRIIMFLAFITYGEFVAAQYLHPTVPMSHPSANVGACMVNTCGATYTDDGGIGGNYSFPINAVYRTFCPDVPGNCTRVTFNSFNVPNCGDDKLEVINGPAQDNQVYGEYCNSTPPPQLVSSHPSGCLTFRFYSFNGSTADGWDATIDCVPCTGEGPQDSVNTDCIYAESICDNMEPKPGNSEGPGLVSESCMSGCFTTENHSSWFYYDITQAGSLEFEIIPNDPDANYDFALYGPVTGGCSNLGTPIRSSFAVNTGSTGLTSSALGTCEDENGDEWLSPATVSVGRYYLQVNRFNAGSVGDSFQIDFGGTAAVGLEAPVIGSNSPLCIDEQLNLTSNSIPGATYHWSGPGGWTSSNQNPGRFPPVPGTYSMYYTLSGCDSEPESLLVVVNSPDISIDDPPAICRGDSAVITASGGGDYLWSTGDSTASITVSPLLTSTYRITVTDTNNCVASDSVTVEVNTLPNIDINPASVEICSGDTTSLIASGGSSYVWSNGDSSAGINVVPQITSVYTVTVTDNNNCSEVDSAQVFVNAIDSSGSIVNACDSYTWDVNGQTYDVSGEYSHTLPGSKGCDSILTVNLTLYSSDSTFEVQSSCNPSDTGVVVLNQSNQYACDSVHTITTTLLPSDSTFEMQSSCNPSDTGTFVVYDMNQYGCDSSHTTRIDLDQTSIFNQNITACDSVEIAGNWYYSSINFSDTLAGASANGCDSIVQYTIEIYSSDQTFDSTTSCNPADTGVVSFTYSNQYGCDSVHTIITTLLPSDTTFEAQSSCNPSEEGDTVLIFTNQYGCDSVHTITTTLLPSDSTFEAQSSCVSSEAGDTAILHINQYGCDSVHVITTTLLPSDSTFEIQSSCNPSDTGTFVVYDTNQYGCDSSHTTRIDLEQPGISNQNIIACDSVEVLGNWHYSSNNFSDTLTGASANGCDSIVQYTIEIYSGDQTFDSITSCNPADSGVVSITYRNQYDCDSVHTITTTLLPSDTTFEAQSSCNPSEEGDTVLIFTNQYGCDSVHTITTALLQSDSTFEAQSSCNPSEEGDSVLVFANQYGCDSVHTITTTLLPSDSTFEVQASCSPADTGLFVSNYPNQYGCDSIHTLRVNLLPSDSTFDNSTTCNPSDSGIFVNNATNQYGCDSVHTLTVTLLPSDSTFENSTSCNPLDTGVFVNNYINQYACDSVHTLTVALLPSDSTFEIRTSCNPADSGIVTLAYINQYGCDSLHTIRTDLDLYSSTNQNITACDSAEVLGNWYYSSTNFNDTIVGGSVNGCDSIILYSITIHNSIQTFENSSSCSPADTGTFIMQGVSQYGCDSVHTTRIDLEQPGTSNKNIIECDSVEIVGNWYYSSINFSDTLAGASANGCDSIVQYTIEIYSGDQTFDSTTSCNPSDTGIVSITYRNQYDCDSVHTITTTLLPSDTTFEAQSSCNPSEEGDTVLVFTNQYGCDSVHTITTTLLPSDSTFETQSSCVFSETGDTAILYTNQYSCDSVHIITTTLLPTDSVFETQSSCNPADTGTVVMSYTNQYGCDSTHFITTNLLPSDSTFELQNSCDPADTALVVLNLSNQYGCDSVHTITTSLLPSDSTFTLVNTCNPADTTVPASLFSNRFGCDSVVVYNYNLIAATDTTLHVSSCDSFTWQLNGITYTASGTYTDTIDNVEGCDSLLTLDLEINNSLMSLENVSACNTFTWPVNGQQYSSSGTYTHVLTNAVDCDSTLVLNLDIEQDIAINTNATICSGDSMFLSGAWRNTPGTYTDTFLSNNNCDSIVNTALLISSNDTGSINISLNAGEYYNGNIYYSDTTVLFNYINPAGCDSTLRTTIEVLGESNIYIPNAFSPNGDGVNDVLELYGDVDNILQIRLRIFDRWGELVYESTDPEFKWDGTLHGAQLSPDVFVFYLRTILKGSDKEKIIKGSLTLIK